MMSWCCDHCEIHAAKMSHNNSSTSNGSSSSSIISNLCKFQSKPNYASFRELYLTSVCLVSTRFDSIARLDSTHSYYFFSCLFPRSHFTRVHNLDTNFTWHFVRHISRPTRSDWIPSNYFRSERRHISSSCLCKHLPGCQCGKLLQARSQFCRSAEWFGNNVIGLDNHFHATTQRRGEGIFCGTFGTSFWCNLGQPCRGNGKRCRSSATGNGCSSGERWHSSRGYWVLKNLNDVRLARRELNFRMSSSAYFKHMCYTSCKNANPRKAKCVYRYM